MLAATYIGHSGWLLETSTTIIAVDPLLGESFGRGSDGAVYPNLWPPRIFKMSSFPAVDAVIITHEHEDHFHLPSLNMFSRDIPILISARSSYAVRQMLEEMGFSVSRWQPGVSRTIGSAHLHSLSGDHYGMPNGDEWDAFAFFVEDASDHSCFFTPVDILPSTRILQEIEAQCGISRKILMFRDEQLRWSSNPRLCAQLAEDARRAENSVEAKEILLGGGAFVPNPGQVVAVRGCDLVGVATSQFLSCPPASAWPEKPDWRFAARSSEYEPACGRRNISEAEISELMSHLIAFAEYLYGTTIFRQLYSLSALDLDGKKGTFAFLTIADEERSYLCFEYDPQRCTFNPVATSNPEREYVAGVECWATDMLALFQGQFEPRILAQGHSRQWTSPQLLGDLFLNAMFPFFHPLRRPQQCLDAYRRRYRQLDSVPVIAYRSALASECTGS
jgi:hypothetical protein